METIFGGLYLETTCAAPYHSATFTKFQVDEMQTIGVNWKQKVYGNFQMGITLLIFDVL